MLVLSYATVNFETQEIIWKAGEFTPKRRNAILKALETNKVSVPYLESVC